MDTEESATGSLSCRDRGLPRATEVCALSSVKTTRPIGPEDIYYNFKHVNPSERDSHLEPTILDETTIPASQNSDRGDIADREAPARARILRGSSDEPLADFAASPGGTETLVGTCFTTSFRRRFIQTAPASQPSRQRSASAMLSLRRDDFPRRTSTDTEKLPGTAKSRLSCTGYVDLRNFGFIFWVFLFCTRKVRAASPTRTGNSCAIPTPQNIKS